MSSKNKKQTILEKNPALIEQFYQLIEAGIPPTRACNYIKIATSTYFSWMAKGRQEKSGIYFNFRNEVLKSETKCMLKNILLVHNREHPKKRLYILDEDGSSIGDRRKSNDWFNEAARMSEFNAYNFNKQSKLYTWGDVWKNIK